MDFGFWILDFKLFCGSEQRPWWMEQIQKHARKRCISDAGASDSL
ncbi:hypothetical protein [Nostoc sp.]